MAPLRVLVVDDDPAIRSLLGDCFEAEGYAVCAAADGAAALVRLDDWRPALIVLDLMMPGVDGWMFRARQQASGDWAQVPVIVLTAGAFPRARVEQLHPAHALRKPFDVEALLTVARETAGSPN